MDQDLTERDYILLRIGKHGPPDYRYSLRLLKLFMGLDIDDRSRCLSDEKYLKSRVQSALAIFQAQEQKERRSTSGTAHRQDYQRVQSYASCLTRQMYVSNHPVSLISHNATG